MCWKYTDYTRSYHHPGAQFWVGSSRNWSVFLEGTNTGRHEKSPVRCPCSRLAALHGDPRTLDRGHTLNCSIAVIKRISFYINKHIHKNSAEYRGRSTERGKQREEHREKNVCLDAASLLVMKELNALRMFKPITFRELSGC